MPLALTPRRHAPFDAAQFGQVLDSGYADAANAAYIQDNSKDFSGAGFNGCLAILLTGGNIEVRRITDAGGGAVTRLNVTPSFTATPVIGDPYVVVAPSANSGGVALLLANLVDTIATRTSSAFVGVPNRGILLRLTTANLTGATATYTLSLAARMQDGTTWVTLWTAAAAVTTAVTVSYLLYPTAGGGSATEKVNLPLPAVYRVVLTVATANVDNNLDTLVDAILLP